MKRTEAIKRIEAIDTIETIEAIAAIRLVCLIALIALLAACSTDESEGPLPLPAQQQEQAQQPIGFAANLTDQALAAGARKAHATATRTRRAAEAGDGELTTALLQKVGFGVYCWYTGSTTFTTPLPTSARTGSTEPYVLLMKNQRVEYTAATSQWTYAPSKYWPLNPDENLTLRAYAPYVSYDLQTDASGMPLLPVVVTKDDYRNGCQHDPLWGTGKHGGTDDEATVYGTLYDNYKYAMSGSLLTKDPRDGTIEWYFHHGMSKLTFNCYLTPDPGCDQVVIKSIEISPLYDKGLLSVSSGTASGSDKPTWTDRASKEPEGMVLTLTDLAEDPFEITSERTTPENGISLLGKGLLIIPRDFSSPNTPMTVVITYSVDDDSSPMTATGTLTQEFYGNTAYTLNLKLNPSTKGLEITMVQSAFTQWTDGGTGEQEEYNW